MERLLRFFILFFISTTVFANNTFILQADAFKNNAPIPARFTCKDKNISPALSWQHAPLNTQSFALILSDPDAPNGTFYHWAVYNIPATTTSLAEGTLPHSVGIAKNSWGNMEYKGPCPPAGKVHHYVFKLYALNTLIAVPHGSDVNILLMTLRPHVIAQTSLTVQFSD
jgi:Raf kinase inhibitor-like YbhB/YbcL family protein